MCSDLFLPGLPVDLIRAAYEAAPGKELASGKFASPESSAALVANALGLFLNQPRLLPNIPGTENAGWPATSVSLEAIVRFPWVGGRHPCLDVLISTQTALVGVESKRYEPFRPKTPTVLSDAYWRPVWGGKMRGFEAVRDGIAQGKCVYDRLDAAQLIKHAFGLRTQASRDPRRYSGGAYLVYLYAEPAAWPDGRAVSISDVQQHRLEIARFSNAVANDEVQFAACAYRTLLAEWLASADEPVRGHAAAVAGRFNV